MTNPLFTNTRQSGKSRATQEMKKAWIAAGHEVIEREGYAIFKRAREESVMPKIEYRKTILREDLRNEPEALFVFGDSMARKGLGGQAKEMRYEPNAVGIPTKKHPSMRQDSFFSDIDFSWWVRATKDDFDRLRDHKGKIVWPSDDIGTGLAQLPERAPKIWNFIQDFKLTLEH